MRCDMSYKHRGARDRLYRKKPGHQENQTATKAGKPHATKIEIKIAKNDEPEGTHTKDPEAKKGPKDPGREKARGPR